jgi:nucleoid-associated protein YgaU
VTENDTVIINKKETVPVKEKTPVPDKKDPPVNPAKTVSAKKVMIKNGETLTRLAYNEYGDKCFWVYIYEENKNIIKNPNDVPAGLTITIPPAEKYKIDKNNPVSINNANAIANMLK